MVMGIYGSLGRIGEQQLRDVRSMLLHRGTSDYIVTREPGITLASLSNRETHVGDIPLVQDIPLVYAGLITNLPALAMAAGRRCDDTSEASVRQVLWALYRRFGVQAFERINGTFAIALADGESESLLLAVDRWAARPLCFTRLDRGWMFASEAKALFAAMHDPPQLDLGVVAHVAATKYLPLHGTLAREVKMVGPGECVRIHLGASHASSYAPLRMRVDPGASEAACAARLKSCILEAARRLTESRDRIGIGLSGGLDSVLTLGAVRAVAPSSQIFTYTAAFHESDPVFARAREAARHFATRHHEIVIAPRVLPALLPELLWRMEDPIAREEMIVYHMIAEHAAREVPIVLYGHMADMLFGGMPRHLLIKMARDWRIARHSILELYDYTQTGQAPRSVLGRLLLAAHLRGPRIDPPRPLGNFERSSNTKVKADNAEALNESLLHGLEHPSEIGAIERIHAWAGVEFGSLFHDGDVANFAFSIPSEMKIRGKSRKHVLRSAARDFLPESFARRPKDLIRIQRDESLLQVLVQLRDELLSSSRIRARGLFDAQYVEALFRRAAKPGCSDAVFYHLWTLLLIELWCRAFGEPHVREESESDAVIHSAIRANPLGTSAFQSDPRAMP